MIFEWKNPGRASALPGSWANVDGRLGIVMVNGSGLCYSQAAAYDPHTAVCPDVLYGSYADNLRHFKAGDTLAHRIVLLLVEVTPKQTASLSQSFVIAQRPGTHVLRFSLPEGGAAEVPLINTAKETFSIPSAQTDEP
jgi:hypothetical protein